MRLQNHTIFSLITHLCVGLFSASLTTSDTWAQKQLDTPLQFVPVDSVVVWWNDPINLSATAHRIGAHLQKRSLPSEKLKRKAFKQAVKQWNEDAPQWLGQGYTCPHWQPDFVAIANGITKAGILFQQTADSRYMDAIERASFNYLLPKVNLPEKLSFERHIAAQALLNTMGMMYATDAEGLFVNLFLNNTTHIKNDIHNFVIDQITAMPYEGRVKIRISGLKKGRTPLTLRLRMPDWATRSPHCGSSYAFHSAKLPLPTIYINGREEQLPMEQGYIVIHRKWNNGDEVFFDFPTDFHRIHANPTANSTPSCTAWQCGPLIYGYTSSIARLTLPEKANIQATKLPNNAGHMLYTIELPDDNGERKTVHLQPAIDGAESHCTPSLSKHQE